jgi:hypothetical protein
MSVRNAPTPPTTGIRTGNSRVRVPMLSRLCAHTAARPAQATATIGTNSPSRLRMR